MTDDDDTPPAEVPNLTLRLVRDTRADIATMLRMMEAMRTDLGGVQERLGAVEGRLEGVEGRLEGVEGRLEGVEGRLEGVEGRVDDLEHDSKRDLDD